MVVRTGLDCLIDSDFDIIRGARIGLVANQTSVSKDHTHIVDAMISSGVDLRMVMSPEHGLLGEAQDGVKIESYVDKQRGIPVCSLYGAHRSPTSKMLESVDAVVFDIQDIGCRYYTFISTMALTMQSCARFGKRFIVLDRPNPINGIDIEGNIPERRFLSFVGLYPIPTRYGLTIGELAKFIDEQYCVGANAEIIPCQGLTRQMWFEDTGIQWVNPSPNMQSKDAALLYPGTCLIEGTNVSEGRGTFAPFQVIGAPWIDGNLLAERLGALQLSGITFAATQFTPKYSKYADIECGGVQIYITDRKHVKPVQTGLYLVKTIHDLYPNYFVFTRNEGSMYHFDHLAGTDQVRMAIDKYLDIDELIANWDIGIKQYRMAIKSCLLYL